MSPGGRVDEAPLADVGARAAYADVLARSPQRSAVASLAFADAACAAFGLAGRLAVARDAGGAPTAGVVTFEKTLGPLRVAARPPLADLCGPVLAAPLRAADVHARASPLDALAAWAGRRYGQVTWALHPSLADARPLMWAGWRLTPTWSYHLDLTSGDVVDRFSRRAAQHARLPDDVLCVADADPATVARLAAASLGRKGVGMPPLGAVGAVARAMVDAGLARAWTAGPPGAEAGAGLVALVEPPVAVYWIVGRTADGGTAATRLVAHVAREAAASGCTALSLGGANVPSVAEFKRRLGAELVPSTVARWTSGPLAVRDALADLLARRASP